jgi:Zn-dependent protease/predicted transcriptional regulator
MFFKNVTLFKCFGFEIKVDASWLFLSVLILWSLASNFYPRFYPGQAPAIYQFMSIATLAGIFVSVIAHEVAHAIVAEYYHMPIENIRLFIFGGVAEMKGEPSHPTGEFLMALAGPAMSCLTGLFFYAWGKLYEDFVGIGAISSVFNYLGTLNLMLAAFNIIPAFPLDGGRALRALLWHKKKNFVLATRNACDLGAFFAYLLLIYACCRIVLYDDLLNGMWLGILGFFMHGGGSYAVKQSESRSLLGFETVERFMTGKFITVSSHLTIHEFVEQYVYKHYQRNFPVVDNGQLLGMISLKSVLALERHKWHWLHVSSVMTPISDQNTVEPGYNAADALDLIQKLGVESLMVSREGRLLGLVTFQDLATYLSISMKIDNNRPVIHSRGID